MSTTASPTSVATELGEMEIARGPPLFANFGTLSRGLLWRGHTYRSSANVRSLSKLTSKGDALLSITSGIENQEGTTGGVDSEGKRTVGVVKNGVVATTGINLMVPHFTLASTFDTSGFCTGSLSIPRDVLVPATEIEVSNMLTEHDHHQPAIMQMRAGINTLVAPWLSLSYHASQTGGLQTLIGSASLAMPRLPLSPHRKWHPSSWSIGSQYKLNLKEGEHDINVGTQYGTSTDAVVSLTTTDNMSGICARYYIPVSSKPPISIAASYHQRPLETKMASTNDSESVIPSLLGPGYSRELSVGAAWMGDPLTWKARVDSDGSIAGVWEIALTPKITAGIASKWNVSGMEFAHRDIGAHIELNA